jgi:hypothetical protein
VNLRRRIGERFELSALPGTSEEEKNSNLHFIIVGGGPTGLHISFAFAFACAEAVTLQSLSSKYVRLIGLQQPWVHLGSMPLSILLCPLEEEMKSLRTFLCAY